MDDENTNGGASLPTNLAALVRARVGALAVETREALLAAACLANPTVELIAQANNTDASHVLSVLDDAKDKGIVEIDGHRVRFSHPLLTRGVYSDNTTARRRAMHRRLADVIEEPELKARHMALAAAAGDEQTLAPWIRPQIWRAVEGPLLLQLNFLSSRLGLAGTHRNVESVPLLTTSTPATPGELA